MPQLVSVNVGLPREVEWRGTKVRSAIWKEPIVGRRMVRRLNIDGDGQADLAGHGGEIRAVMVYQLGSYRYWESQLQRHDFVPGQFGENFTVDGLPDDEVCIGDRYRIGEALFEVTQPRVTCYRVGIRMDEPKMAALLVAHHRPGFYFRVLAEGLVGAGDEIEKVADGPERVTVAEIDSLLYLPGHGRDLLARAVRIPALSPGWKGSLQALLEQGSGSGNSGLTGLSGGPAAWPGFRKLKVKRVEHETDTVFSFYLESTDGSVLPLPLPGQYLVIRIHPAADQPPVLRNYSLSGVPDGSTYRISVKREANGVGSGFLHGHCSAGDEIESSAPRGSFTLRPGDGPVVLMSAGIGVTPVLAMLYALAQQQSTRPVWWLYGARDKEEHPFAEEARRLASSMPHCRSYIAYSKPGAADQMGREFDAQGHLSVKAVEELQVPKEAEFYLCGQASFLDTFKSGLSDWGVAPQRVYSEIFGPVGSMTPGVVGAVPKGAKVALPLDASSPQVAFTRSGVTVSWNSKFQSILELAEAANVPARWSCRTGVCHTCESSLIGGEVAYDPEPLDPPAEGKLLICCSTPRGDVQIDL